MKLPRDISGAQLAERLSKLEFSISRQVGSHIQIKHSSGELITIPAHSPLKVGTLSAILRDVSEITGKSREDILQLLR